MKTTQFQGSTSTEVEPYSKPAMTKLCLAKNSDLL